jgi:hypothetical protein
MTVERLIDSRHRSILNRCSHEREIYRCALSGFPPTQLSFSLICDRSTVILLNLPFGCYWDHENSVNTSDLYKESWTNFDEERVLTTLGFNLKALFRQQRVSSNWAPTQLWMSLSSMAVFAKVTVKKVLSKSDNNRTMRLIVYINMSRLRSEWLGAEVVQHKTDGHI